MRCVQKQWSAGAATIRGGALGVACTCQVAGGLSSCPVRAKQHSGHNGPNLCADPPGRTTPRAPSFHDFAFSNLYRSPLSPRVKKKTRRRRRKGGTSMSSHVRVLNRQAVRDGHPLKGGGKLGRRTGLTPGYLVLMVPSRTGGVAMKSMFSAQLQKQNTRTPTVPTAPLLADAWAHVVMFLQRRVASRRARRHFPKSTQQLLSALLFRTAVRSEKRQERAAVRTCSADAGASPSALQGREMCSLSDRSQCPRNPSPRSRPRAK
eukprot:COSAG04_NODE_430_length_14511_cov_936.561079_1_plen_263_part_00